MSSDEYERPGRVSKTIADQKPTAGP